MPLEIKSKDKKKVYAIAIVCDTTRCGNCDMPLLDGQAFWALDDPYSCIVHEHCLRHFRFNGKPRCRDARGRKELKDELSTDEETIAQYMSRPFFNTRVPKMIREAWMRVFGQALAMRRTYSPGALKAQAEKLADLQIVDNNVGTDDYIIRECTPEEVARDVAAEAEDQKPKVPYQFGPPATNLEEN